MVYGQLVEDTACFKAIDNTSDCGKQNKKIPASLWTATTSSVEQVGWRIL
jgi:hypothetical protein